MAIAEQMDVTLVAKTKQFDQSVRDTVDQIRSVDREFQNMSISMAAFAPVTSSITEGVAGMLSAIPGVSGAVLIFNATAAAINAAFNARYAMQAKKIADAVEELAAKSKTAAAEVHSIKAEIVEVIDKAEELEDIVDAEWRVIDPNIPKISQKGGMAPYRPQGPKADGPQEFWGVYRGRASQFDDELRKTATFKSSWTEVATAARTAGMVGTAGAAAIAAGVGVAIAGVVALGVAWHNVSEAMKEIDALSDSASKLGMTFRDLSNVRLSLGESSGLDAASIDGAMSKMTMGLAEANTKQAGDLFEQLRMIGLDAGELLRMGPAKAMEEIAAKTQEMRNPTDQLVLAYELFGKQGAALVSSLRDGPNAMREMAEFADTVGMNLTQAQAEQVGAANDAWGRVEMVATGAWRQIAAEAAPVLTVIYEAIAEGASQFSRYLEYLPAVIDFSAVFAGTIYDVVELSQVLQSTLYNIVTLNWSEVGKDIQSAFTFDSGDKWLAQIQKARNEAAGAAQRKAGLMGNEESAIAALERQKELTKEREAMEAKGREEYERAQTAREREARQSEAAVKKRFDAARQELEIQKILASMSAAEAKKREGEIRERFALHAELREQGMSDFSVIDGITAEANRLKEFNEQRNQQQERFEKLQEKALDLTRSMDPAIGFRETVRELEQMRAAGMISNDVFARAGMDAAKKLPGGEYKGAESAQAGSVEAYKLLLARENANKGKDAQMLRLQEEQLSVQREMVAAMRTAPVLRGARK